MIKIDLYYNIITILFAQSTQKKEVKNMEEFLKLLSPEQKKEFYRAREVLQPMANARELSTSKKVQKAS